ncbi:MAG: uracil-DNA glycosylase [Nevskia sp.]|nr:uracil-DNA glycosylase [Nevskia sp.]
MDTKRRRHYLDALGLESWQSRGAGKAAQAAPLAASASMAAPAAAAPLAPAEAAHPAPAAAAAHAVPKDWDGLKAAVAGCLHCKLCKTRTNTVFGVGHPAAPLMVIGEGPGADEDAQGEPFVGRAGKLLDEMLRAIGRSRRAQEPAQSVFIANVVKCRPPGNRDPEPDEVQACRPYLDQQIRLVRPHLIVALGRVAAQRLLATDAPLSKLRGPLYEYGPEHTPVLVTYHPAYLLRSPGEKAKSWTDLKRVHQLLRAGT